MSDENEIEQPEGGNEDSGSLGEDVGSDIVFRVDKDADDDVIKGAARIFVVSYMALLLVALTLRIFERRK